MQEPKRELTEIEIADMCEAINTLSESTCKFVRLVLQMNHYAEQIERLARLLARSGLNGSVIELTDLSRFFARFDSSELASRLVSEGAIELADPILEGINIR